MIKRLRYKFVLIVMAVVTLILLGILFTMLVTTQKNNERMSSSILYRALDMRSLPGGSKHPFGSNPSPSESAALNMRVPVLVVQIENGSIHVAFNLLYFIKEDDIESIAALASGASDNMGVLKEYKLRYLRVPTETGFRIAFTDISMEQEMSRSQFINSLLIGGAAMVVFFFLSLFLAHWAVRPVESAWEQQKQFIANASHELKTPLTVILSNADMLRTGNSFEDDKNTSRLEHIHAEAVRMKQLVEDMLTLARSDSAQSEQIHCVVDFSYVVKSAVLMYEPIIYDEGKKLSFEIMDNLSVIGDTTRLEQVMHILMDNACKYSIPGGAIRIDLSKAEHKKLILKVSNEGAPIPQDELERIFLRFYRRNESRSEHGSFGLGLSIAKSIVSEHKGRIWAESDEKQNSFYVSLPLVQ